MSKPFFEVFDNLKIKDNLEDLFRETYIERIVNDECHRNVRIYLSSQRLISREDIVYVQKEIERNIFGRCGYTVRIYEKFSLSSQYNARSLWEVYKDSLLYDVKNHSEMCYQLLRNADFDFKADNELNIVLEANLVSENKFEEIVDIFQSVINDRCGLNAQIYVTFKEYNEDKYKDEIKHKEKMLLENIRRKAYGDGKTVNDDGEIATVEGQGQDDMFDSMPVKASEGNSSKTDKDTKKDTDKSADKYKERKPLKRSDDPEVLYGRDVMDDPIPISDIQDEIGEATIRGKIVAADGHSIRNGKYVFSFNVTDFTDSISVKIFCWEDQVGELSGLTEGTFVKVKGIVKFDDFVGELIVSNPLGIRKIPDFTTIRMDNSLYKRVELHCHTKMSDSDGVTYAKDLIKRANKWGMKALAITDHGVVQAFPEANHAVEDLKIKDDFKVLYGCEAYLVDDLAKTVENCKEQTLLDDFVVFAIRKTGFVPQKDKIIEIGAVRVSAGAVVGKFSEYINPRIPISFEVEKNTGIKDILVKDALTAEEVIPKFYDFAQGAVLVGFDASVDFEFIRYNTVKLGLEDRYTYVDILPVARTLVTKISKHTIEALCKNFGIAAADKTRAADEAECLNSIYANLIEMLHKENVFSLEELKSYTESSVENIRKLPSYHVILIAKNETGRVNLYRMVSESHLKYFNRRPKLPKSYIEEHREGIIVGSACEAGELYRALVGGKSDEDIAKIVSFYDYLEIQPLGNNKYMIDSEKFPNINSFDDIKDVNRRVVKLGEEYNKPVCATCDVHFLDPEDEVYRRIIMAGKGYEDCDDQAPLYLRTTEEMLAEFEYLGSDKAMEVVVTNTNLIADMCDFVCPIHPDKCPPVIPNSDGMLREICETRAHEIYGDELPTVVSERLERELNSIISNGFAVMYIIAQKLVWKSNEDGYLVGSRGSVGSSFVATMAGITEVNPLSPHYYCSNCHYSEFDSPEVKAFSGMAGCDMPDKICPVCGEKLKKDGFDIPFETFLGFKGDKEPDIDLNFSGEYQSKAHKYTEVIFGAGQTFKAGTIGTLAEKTAFGYVKKYYEERGIKKRTSEIERIVKGCVDVRRTTGQHPGGIIVLPLGHDINQFTPVQHPANDITTDIVTTHFDYHSIDHNLLKLDILGHDDPTMIRMLQDLTGLDPRTIPLDDKGVMSLFSSTQALGIEPKDIEGCKLGTLGIPEFGTDFAMQMLIDTKPTHFSDLVRIAGLSHGTDVWLGNAQTLIEEGKATISTAICTRDDIMVYLISMGLDAGMSFSIMENVRKGKVAKGKCKDWDGWKQEMVDHGVPDWYIWSCERIQYMFPKAHAAAYVMMAWRIAYCKVYYPLAYYSAYFSIRATAFDYEMMCQGRAHLDAELKSLRSLKDPTPKDEDSIKDMRLVQEMYARGLEFMPIDIFKAHARNFQIIDGKIMPALTSISGVADKAAEGIVEACKGGPFMSRDDFKERSKAGQSVTDTMARLGLLGNLPESNQYSLFDVF